MKALDAKEQLRGLLVGQAIDLREDDSHAFVGRGADAPAAWAAFKELAARPAYEPMPAAEGITRCVDPTRDGDLLLFETAVHPRRSQQGWRSRSEPEVPRAFVLLFTRQFSFEDEHQEYLGMNALTFDIEFDPADELVALPLAQKWECGGPPWTEAEWRRRGEAPRPYGAAQDWIEWVERSEPFRLAFDGRGAERFYFEQTDV
jgi:hypothetical protein